MPLCITRTTSFWPRDLRLCACAPPLPLMACPAPPSTFTANFISVRPSSSQGRFPFKREIYGAAGDRTPPPFVLFLTLCVLTQPFSCCSVFNSRQGVPPPQASLRSVLEFLHRASTRAGHCHLPPPLRPKVSYKILPLEDYCVSLPDKH